MIAHYLPVIVHRTLRVAGDDVTESVVECDHPECGWRFPLDDDAGVSAALAAYTTDHAE